MPKKAKMVPDAGKAMLVPASGIAHATEADRRREVLRRLLRTHGLRPSSLARLLGLSTANSFYNFLGGRSDSFSQRILEGLISAFPDGSAQEMLVRSPEDARPERCGTPDASGPAPSQLLHITMVARAGYRQSRSILPAAQQRAIWLPPVQTAMSQDVFGVLVAAPGAEPLHPGSTVLVCVGVEDQTTPHPEGCHLIVQQNLLDGVELAHRQVHRRDGLDWLLPGSSHPDCQEAIPAPWHRQDAWRVRHIVVVGRVIACWQILPTDS